jgi:hypothetical protein
MPLPNYCEWGDMAVNAMLVSQVSFRQLDISPS